MLKLMKRLVSVVVLVDSAWSLVNCPSDWHRDNTTPGICYLDVPAPNGNTDMNSAQLYCRSLTFSDATTARLPIFQSETEYVEFSKLSPSFDELEHYWLGLYADDSGGDDRSYVWPDGSARNFSMWDIGEPKNEKPCAITHLKYVRGKKQYYWQSADCNQSYHVVCQLRLTM